MRREAWSSRRRPGSSFSESRPQKLDSSLRRNDGRRAFVLFFRLALAIGFAVSPLAHAIDPLPFKDRAEEVRFQALTKQLRCLVCQNENLADSERAARGRSAQ